MARRSQRNRRPQGARDPQAARSPQAARGQSAQSQASRSTSHSASNGAGDRYEKYLPTWMKGSNGAPVRPPRQRRARQPRPAGGYTPGKFALDGGERF